MGTIGLKKYRVIVIGPESSGSALVSRIVAHVIGSRDYHIWDGLGKTNEVWHISVPTGSGDQRRFLDISEICAEKYIVVSRDQNCCVLSKVNRGFCENTDEARMEMEVARKFLSRMFLRDAFVFSYETFLFYKLAYLKRLYEFLGVESDFLPDDLYDGNEKWLSSN